MAENHDYAVAVAILTPKGIVLVKRTSEELWVFPGGKGRSSETSLTYYSPSDVLFREKRTAVEKVFAKTGIRLHEKELRTLHAENRVDHQFYLFAVEISANPALKDRMGNKLIGGIFTPQKLRALTNFFPPHQALFLKYLASIAPDEDIGEVG